MDSPDNAVPDNPIADGVVTDPNDQVTTPQANDATTDNKPALMKSRNERLAGWKNIKVDIVNGLIGMMHDGDQ